MPIYTRADFRTRINAGIKNKIGILISDEDTMNDAVRAIISDIDLRSTKTRSTLSPNLFTDVYQYACPSDMKGVGIIGLSPQADNISSTDFNLVPPEEFNQKKDDRSVSFSDHDSLRKILISAQINDQTQVISTLDSITSGGGTWVVAGDATNLVATTDNYIKGAASLSWDINSAGGTTAGIKNTSLNTFDFTNYKNNSVFIWQYIQSITGLTNFILKLGSSSSNYYSKTVTSTHEGTAFTTGWNLLRFDFTGATTTGTPVLTAFNYAEFYMTKTAGKIAETGYLSDNLQAKKGAIFNLTYYSKYGWQDSSGVWKENSTADTDLLNADTDEYNLFIQKGIEMAAAEIDEENIQAQARANLYGAYYRGRQISEGQVEKYQTRNPSEALVMVGTVYNF